jgi:hypothetical protein
MLHVACGVVRKRDRDGCAVETGMLVGIEVIHGCVLPGTAPLVVGQVGGCMTWNCVPCAECCVSDDCYGTCSVARGG